ncbi:hypothetical protein NDU88_006437 [Pleurodeles waltl]|uniref:Uncharacterized protein n=1 Tax=Pleurodeles waltl TaxID=8319 RepID=A0AAV7SPS1_PLEWA|nr:hypothetical protein NDU88_006437 [Pleurodeles waltl]
MGTGRRAKEKGTTEDTPDTQRRLKRARTRTGWRRSFSVCVAKRSQVAANHLFIEREINIFYQCSVDFYYCNDANHVMRLAGVLLIRLLRVKVCTQSTDTARRPGRHSRTIEGPADRNTDKWLRAFRTQAIIFVGKFSRSAPALFLHEQKVHEAHLKYQGDAWLRYDEGFREKVQTWPITE